MSTTTDINFLDWGRQLSQQEIEKRYGLHSRMLAVQSAANARAYLQSQRDAPFLDRCNAVALLADGLINALDGRATGFEWRTLRWAASNKEIQSGEWQTKFGQCDDRCDRCGAARRGAFSCPC